MARKSYLYIYVEQNTIGPARGERGKTMATQRANEAWELYVATCRKYGIEPTGLSPADIDEMEAEDDEDDDEDEAE